MDRETIETDQYAGLGACSIEAVEEAEHDTDYQAIFAASSDGLVVNDLETGIVVEVNPAFCRMHGYSREELVGRHPITFIHPDFHPLFADYLAAIRAGGELRAAARDVRKDGNAFPVEVHGSRFRFRGRPHALGVVRDMTERELESARLYRQAQDEARRTAALARIASSVALAGSLGMILDGLAQSVVEATDADGCAAILLDGEPPRMRYAGAFGLPKGFGAAMAESVRRGGPLLSAAALEEGRPLVMRNVWQTMLARAEFAPVHGFREQVGWDTVVVAPMVARGRRLGTLVCYYRRDREPDATEIAFQGAIASQAAVAVENAHLFAEAQDRAVLEERTRLAHELHDSATQTVFSLGMLARAAQVQHTQGSAKLGATLERVATLAQEALLEMRALLFELRPDTLIEQGLDAALARLVETFRPRTGMVISYDGAPAPRLGAGTEMAIFRIVQEALGNAVKHAQASEASVRLCAEDGKLKVIVHDNGRGFDPATPVIPSSDGQRGGQGLRSMRERAASAGLYLRVVSAPGAGTTVTIEATPLLAPTLPL